MLPGGMDPRKMKAMMKQMGIEQEELRDVLEVVIRMRSKELVFKEPQVVEVRAQGSRTYQVVGRPVERAPSSGAPSSGAPASGAPSPPPRREEPHEPSEFPEDDVRLVMDQAGCSRRAAIGALRSAEGSPAEAILSLMS